MSTHPSVEGKMVNVILNSFFPLLKSAEGLSLLRCSDLALLMVLWSLPTLSSILFEHIAVWVTPVFNPCRHNASLVNSPNTPSCISHKLVSSRVCQCVCWLQQNTASLSSHELPFYSLIMLHCSLIPSVELMDLPFSTFKGQDAHGISTCLFCCCRSGFPGAQPVSMDRQNINFLEHNPYKVSWKADGTRWVFCPRP